MKVFSISCAWAALTVLSVPLSFGKPLTNLEWKTNEYARIEGKYLIVDVPKERGHIGAVAMAKVDLSEYDGMEFFAEINSEGKDITVPKQTWNGLKFMFTYSDADTGKMYYSNTLPKLGSYSNQVLNVNSGADRIKRKGGYISLGLQGSSGRVVFDLSTLKIDSIGFPVVNQDYKVTYPDYVKSRPQLRGVMLRGDGHNEDDFKTLHEWGVTLVRYQMVRGFNKKNINRDLPDFDKWLGYRLNTLEKQILPWAKKYGMKVIVDLHNPPGGREETSDWTMYFNKEYAHHFIECWKRIATRFKDNNECIYGYDLVNEPCQTKRATAYDYWTIQKMAAEAVRKIDPNTTIIIESNDWAAPGAFKYLSPLAMDNVIYQFHMYVPHAFTHQGIGDGDGTKACEYPNEKMKWNKDKLKASVQAVVDFQKKHNVKILVGEFSAISWAKGADQYLADCIDIFNEHGWDWTYHAFREYQGWSVEHEHIGAKKFQPSKDNPRKRVLLKAFNPDYKRKVSCL